MMTEALSRGAISEGWQDWASQDLMLIEFLTEIMGRFDNQAEFSAHLPDLLEEVGRFLRVPCVTITFEGEGGIQEITWRDKAALCKNDLGEAYLVNLRNMGAKDKITFYGVPRDRTLRAFCLLVAAFIESRLAAEQIIRKEHLQRLLAESINQISKVLTSTLDRDELLGLFLDQLASLVPYDSANVMLLQDGVLFMHAARGYEEFSGPVDISQISFIPDQTFLIDEVLTGDQPVILHDTLQSPQWRWTPCGGHIRSWMGVPLRVKGNVIGLFSLDKSIPNFFNDTHAKLASTLAQHAALALDNAILFTELQEAHRNLQRLSSRIITAQEEERRKIAQELHDHAGQALLALRAELRVLRSQLERDLEKAYSQIEYLDQIILELSHDLEHLAYDLRPPALATLGLASSVEQYVTEFSRRMNIQVEFNHNIERRRFPEDIELVCYRVLQEALTNVVKHADASQVMIEMYVNADHVLQLKIKDNGKGFDVAMRAHHGLGLFGIRERLNYVGGKLIILSNPEHGTEVIAQIPLPTKTNLDL